MVAVTLTAASMVIIPYVARFFVGYDPELLALGSRLLHTEEQNIQQMKRFL